MIEKNYLKTRHEKIASTNVSFVSFVLYFDCSQATHPRPMRHQISPSNMGLEPELGDRKARDYSRVFGSAARY